MNWSTCLFIAIFIWSVDCQTRPIRKYKVKENKTVMAFYETLLWIRKLVKIACLAPAAPTDKYGSSPQSGDRVVVHYTGHLKGPNNTIGTKFDSSRDRNEPFRFTLFAGEVISGWDSAVNSMRVGDRSWFDIPAEQGYGARGAPPAIPPNADLLFDIELLGIEPRQAAQQVGTQGKR